MLQEGGLWSPSSKPRELNEFGKSVRVETQAPLETSLGKEVGYRLQGQDQRRRHDEKGFLLQTEQPLSDEDDGSA